MGWSGSIRVADLVDTATGATYKIRRAREPAATYGRRFSVIFDDTTSALASTLSGTAARLLLALPARLNFRTFRRLPQSELAEHLGITQSVISRALSELRRHGVVETQGRGVTVEWRLTRVVGYRGTAGQYHADQRQDRVSQPISPDQAALRLGPMRVIRGGRKSASKPSISQDQPAPA